MRFRFNAALVAIVMALGVSPSTAMAQDFGPVESLAGYGAFSGSVTPNMANSSGNGAMVIPYAGMTEGFMPSRMGGGASLAFRSRATTTMSPARALSSFGFSTMSGGMGRSLGLRSSMTTSSGSKQVMGVMPTRIAYPFRQPPSLGSSVSTRSGMSM